MDYKTAPLAEIKAEILEDGIIDAQEAASLKERLYDDGIIDQEEADFLFEVNDAVSGNTNDPAWKDLFVQGVSDFVLADEKTPGEVDADEAAYLIKNIEGDGKIDDVEKALLQNIKAKATSIDPSLNFLIEMSND